MGARMMNTGPSLYGDLTTEHAGNSRMLDESIIEAVDDEDDYRCLVLWTCRHAFFLTSYYQQGQL